MYEQDFDIDPWGDDKRSVGSRVVRPRRHGRHPTGRIQRKYNAPPRSGFISYVSSQVEPFNQRLLIDATLEAADYTAEETENLPKVPVSLGVGCLPIGFLRTALIKSCASPDELAVRLARMNIKIRHYREDVKKSRGTIIAVLGEPAVEDSRTGPAGYYDVVMPIVGKTATVLAGETSQLAQELAISDSWKLVSTEPGIVMGMMASCEAADYFMHEIRAAKLGGRAVELVAPRIIPVRLEFKNDVY